MLKVGFLINPIAGMGGSVGLKGTDGDLYQIAADLGATQVSLNTASTFLESLSSNLEMEWFTAPGEMGEKLLLDRGFDCSVVGKVDLPTSAEDTSRISRQMIADGINLLVFVGGDGTARDIYNAVGINLPVVAVPAGVKVFSSVFAYSAEAAADLVQAFHKGTTTSLREVLDINEEAYRQGELVSSLYGYLLTPDLPEFVQPGKATYGSQPSNEDSIQDIAAWMVEKMDPETVYLLGPGSTVKAITDTLDLKKTLLGVDAIYQNELIECDLNEEKIQSLLKTYKMIKIVVTPIGGNGFIFGRGNKQFTPSVIRQVGKKNIIVVAAPDKLSNLDCLRVDTGNSELDRSLSGYINVISGYQESRMMKVCH